MAPSNELVLRRRHLVLIILRLVALAMILYGATISSWQVLDLVLWAGSGGLSPERVLRLLFPLFFYVGIGLLIARLSDRLARWIVPALRAGNACIHCGYSVKNLRSPICPECGGDIAGLPRS